MPAFDVLVIGGGHAGVEAAAAAARRGARVGLITFDARNIGQMSCNPAIGGIGKGHLVREVDVFDGVIAKAADHAAIHHRMLNRSKGVAVWGPRVQADRSLFSEFVRRTISEDQRVTVIEGDAHALEVAGDRVTGVFVDGARLAAKAVIVAAGTFLRARLHHGLKASSGGRVRERAATHLGEQLSELSGSTIRLKTGTPPRLDGRTIDWTRLERQASDADAWAMGLDRVTPPPQLACFVGRTNRRTHQVVADACDQSPLYAGSIEGRGPRYCPSIEDKIVRFADRDEHQIFFEPEQTGANLVYPNGVSTSLPAAVQTRFLRTIEGLEVVEMIEPGYAVEYDALDPRGLDHRLARRSVPNLFMAGQINGTTGYEEAAAQGLVVGLNAAAEALGWDPVTFDPDHSYIGVMIADLTRDGASEPYRMLTARADRRLHLRADNAEARLGDIAVASGAVSPQRVADHERRKEKRAMASAGTLPPSSREDREIIAEETANRVYAPYLARQLAEAKAIEREDRLSIAGTSFEAVAGLSTEMRERLSLANPETLGEARRVRGVTPAALAAILISARVV